jgi:hypothetical protein
MSSKNNNLCSSFKTAWNENFTTLEQHELQIAVLPMARGIAYLLMSQEGL